MKKACCALTCMALLATPYVALAADDVTIDSGTLFGVSRRDVVGTSKETLLPVTQFVDLTADRLGNSKLSVHLYGWGRFDLADRSYDDKPMGGSLTYGYFQYTPGQANSSVRAGRLFVREGILNEQLDGVSARTDLPGGYTVSAFGGAPVHTVNLSGESSDGKGNSLYGGRLSYRHKGLLEIGLAGVREGDAPQLANHTVGSYRRVGGDLWYTPVYGIDIIGHSSYNTETKEFAEHSYLVNVKKFQKLVLTGEFNVYHEQSLLASSAMFSSLLTAGANNQSSTVGLTASYEVSKTLDFSADYKHYSRDFGSADRFGGDARVHYKDNSIRGGFGYHYLNAGQGFAIGATPSASYHELRCYLMRDTKGYFAAADILGDFFTDQIYNQNSAWETTVSLGYHFTPVLALSGDLSYGRNPQFTEEARALLRLTYNTTFSGTGGKK